MKREREGGVRGRGIERGKKGRKEMKFIQLTCKVVSGRRAGATGALWKSTAPRDLHPEVVDPILFLLLFQ